MRLPRLLSAAGLAPTTTTTIATATTTTTATATSTRFYYDHSFLRPSYLSLRQVSRSFFKMVAPWAAMSQDNYPALPPVQPYL